MPYEAGSQLREESCSSAQTAVGLGRDQLMSHSVSETVEDVGSHRIKEASVLSIPDLSVQRVRSMNAIRQLKPLVSSAGIAMASFSLARN